MYKLLQLNVVRQKWNFNFDIIIKYYVRVRGLKIIKSSFIVKMWRENLVIRY